MVEGENEGLVEQVAAEIADAVRKAAPDAA